MSTLAPEPTTGRLFHRPLRNGPGLLGPRRLLHIPRHRRGVRRRILCDGGARNSGRRPPHIYTREDETYYILAGQIEVLLGEETTVAGPNDFVNVPRGTVHCFRNTGTETARMLLTFPPAGIEKWSEETLERAPNEAQEAPDNIDEVVARYVAAAPRYGLEFV